MRTLALPLLLIALMAFVPQVPAGYVRSSTVGLDLGYGDAGVWEVWEFTATGGPSTGFSVQWSDPRADYDLYLYPPGSMDDGRLTETPIAAGETEALGPNAETFFVADLPAGKYYVAVVARQSLDAPYDLYANPGTFGNVVYGAVGVRVFCPAFYPECDPR